MKLNCRRKWSEITKCRNKCQNFPLTVLLQINIDLQCWIPRFSKYNSTAHRQCNSYWPSFKDWENTVFRDHRTHVFIDTPTCHSVRHFSRTHPWLQTDHLTRSFFFPFAQRALCARQRALGDLPLPFAVLSHLSWAGRMVSDRVRYIHQLRASDTTMELYLE